MRSMMEEMLQIVQVEELLKVLWFTRPSLKKKRKWKQNKYSTILKP